LGTLKQAKRRFASRCSLILPILIIEARMKGANEMREPDFEVQEIEIGEPVESDEQGFGVTVCGYIY
jgi:hypothetical protein